MAKKKKDEEKDPAMQVRELINKLREGKSREEQEGLLEEIDADLVAMRDALESDSDDDDEEDE